MRDNARMTRFFWSLAFALAFAPAMALAAPPSLALEELTWTELREAVKGGATTILVPIGGTEQNGPHIALGKHNARASDLAQDIARTLGRALVAPVIAYVPEGEVDPPTGHMKYPGTISIPENAFERTLEGAAESFRRAGFRDVVFLGDHGGYRKSIARSTDRLNRRWGGSGARAHSLPEYYAELPHAGRDDTSMSLAGKTRPLVRTDRIGPEAARGQGAAQDPTGATAEAGVALRQAVVDRSVEALRKALARR